ncbi:recombinase family protein [Anaeromyxobacter soli]|uniref:recombinase family protein n=1 Tax=Anaeromyxobacter soli TaxID=2922725 RepID=UPI001FAE98B6|nr:recombinase family protein [Anaeromyxobacter sp. SG29]
MGERENLDCAVVYARFSTKKQDPRSIDDQFRRCEEYAGAEGLKVVSHFKDEGISGSRQDRPGLELLLSSLRKRPLPFCHVLVDDSSRLSRDDIDAKTIVFRTLRGAGVVVHDVSSRTRSDDDNAELLWGVKGLIDAQYVRDLRKKTHRGLEGRALAGKHTGGRCFGYISIEEEAPADPEHACSILRVDDEQAKLVRRIFQMYADGAALGTIVETLNREGIPAPYDGKGYSKPTGGGWSKNQVSSMLRNERYIGVIIWNRREFYRDPVTRKRRARLRDESEWKRLTNPELRIVSDDLWDRVQTRRGIRSSPKGGRPPGTGRHVSILSGLLRCSECGGPMSIVGGTVRGDKRLVNYGCSTNHAKGTTVCSNSKRISERKARHSIVQFAIEFLQSDDFRTWVEAGRRRAQEAQSAAVRANDHVAALEAEVKAQERKVDRLLDALLGDLKGSEGVNKRLKAEEAKLVEMRGKLTALARTGRPRQPPVISIDALVADLRSLGTLTEKDPTAARDALHRVVESVTLKPVGDEYEATLAFRNTTAAIAGGRVGAKGSCGGRI